MSTKSVTVRIPEELYNSVAEQAETENRTVSNMIIHTLSKKLIRCKDCKYYESVDGIFPVCHKWAKGCQTESDGYCFLGEKKGKI